MRGWHYVLALAAARTTSRLRAGAGDLAFDYSHHGEDWVRAGKADFPPVTGGAICSTSFSGAHHLWYKIELRRLRCSKYRGEHLTNNRLVITTL